MHAYTVVDAFTTTPLEGNPVAVFFDADDLSAATMQSIAREMHLSECTFVLRAKAGGDAHIRIFTPVNELPFAGHPLLGAAIALGTSTKRDELSLETRMGAIPFTLGRRDGEVVGAWMRQPVPSWEPFDRAGELLAALGVESSTLPVEIYHNGPRHVFVGLESEAALARLSPDHRRLATFPDMATNCFAGSGRKWQIRMFSPAYGVVEDAATGSAAGPLALHLARHGLARRGQPIDIAQGLQLGRPSLMKAVVRTGADGTCAVEVGGSGVTVAQGTIYV